jgi:hypothetical protein
MWDVLNQASFAVLSLGIALVGWANYGIRSWGLFASLWYLGQASDEFFDGNLAPDGVWEYWLFGLMCAVNIFQIRLHERP